MKKGYKRILIFEIVISLILILNSFVSNILGEYNIIILLITGIVLFKLIFGYEKDKHRYKKDIIFDILIYLLMFYMLYYALGFIIGFARTDNYYTFVGLKDFIIPTILFVISKEVLRYMILTKSQGCNLLTITTFVLFIFLDLTNSLYYNKFALDYNTFVFIALTILPSISNNLFCTFLSKKVGLKPSIFYLLTTQLFLYLIPIVPDPNEYLASVINFVLPIVLWYKVYKFFDKETDEYKGREYNKTNKVALASTLILIVIMVYFTSGYFHYHAIAIASGSMSPNINKGDVAVVEKIDRKYDKLKEGQVIAYRYNDIIVVHRLTNIVKEDGKYYFYTKGDANKNVDNYTIEEDMVIGIVYYRVPYIGIPTVWLRETVF